MSPTSGAQPAVFLSYASQDAEAARRICEALRATGVEVWFDQSELRGGDAWDAKIRKQIKECALFVPIISANTQARREGYFRLEWRLAVERMRHMDDDLPFLVPIVIDQTTDAEAFVPEKFREVQWTRVRERVAEAAFAAHVQQLLARTDDARQRPSDALTSGGPAHPARPHFRGRARLAVAAVLIVAGLGTIFWNTQRRPQSPPPPAKSARAPESEAQVWVRKAWDQLNRPGRDRTELEIADDLCRRATVANPDDTAAWAAWSQVHSWYIYYNLDGSEGRRELARSTAARAVKLDPKSFEGRLAEAAYLVRTARGAASGLALVPPEAETSLRALLIERPNEGRVCFALAILLRNTGKDDEALDVFDVMAATPAFAAEALTEKAWALYLRGKYADAQSLCDRGIAQGVFQGNLLLRIYLALNWSGDLELARATAANLTPDLLQGDKLGFFAARVYWWRREPAAMRRVLDGIPRPWLTWWSMPKSYLIGHAHLLAGQKEAAAVAWTEALRQVVAQIAKEPESSRHMAWKAELLGLLGKREEAEAALRLARSLGMPSRASTFSVPTVWSIPLAMGDRAVAMDALERNYRSAQSNTWASFRYNPLFDPLRNEPRFQALLARAEADPERNPHAKARAETPTKAAAEAKK